MVNVSIAERSYRAFGPRGGMKMSKNNLSRREFFKFLGLFFAGLFAIRWQKIIHIFSKKVTPPNLKEAKHYSRGDEMAG